MTDKYREIPRRRHVSDTFCWVSRASTLRLRRIVSEEFSDLIFRDKTLNCVQHEILELIFVRHDNQPVDFEKDGRGQSSDALVTVVKRVILHEAKEICGGKAADSAANYDQIVGLQGQRNRRMTGRSSWPHLGAVGVLKLWSEAGEGS